MKERTFAPTMPMASLSTRESQILAFPGSAFLEIDVELIDENPFGPREVYLPEVIEKMAAALKEQGQHDPIHVRPNPGAQGRYIICDGWTRVQACKIHGALKKLKAFNHPDLDAAESGWFGYQQNEERNQHFDYDRARFYSKMIEAGMTAAEVARRAGISEPLMSTFRSFFKIDELIMDEVRKRPDRFSASVVYQLSRAQSEHGARMATSHAVWFANNPTKTRQDLIDRIENKGLQKQGKSPKPNKMVRYANGSYKWKGDRVYLDFRFDEAEQAHFEKEFDAFVERIGKPIPTEEKSAKQKASAG